MPSSDRADLLAASQSGAAPPCANRPECPARPNAKTLLSSSHLPGSDPPHQKPSASLPPQPLSYFYPESENNIVEKVGWTPTESRIRQWS